MDLIPVAAGFVGFCAAAAGAFAVAAAAKRKPGLIMPLFGLRAAVDVLLFTTAFLLAPVLDTPRLPLLLGTVLGWTAGNVLGVARLLKVLKAGSGKEGSHG